MFSRSKPTPPKREKKKDLPEFALFGVSDDLDDIPDSDGDDDDLEAELAAITAGGGKKVRPKPKRKGVVAPENLDAMVAASLRDIGSDEELSGDEDDPDLLNELSEITGVSEEYIPDESPSPVVVPTKATSNSKDVIKARIEMYTQAEANAKATGDSGRARRFNRGLKTLKDLLKHSEAGKAINPDEIPPEVSVKPSSAVPVTETPDAPPPVPQRRAPPPPPPVHDAPVFESTSNVPEPEAEENPKIKMLNGRKLEYKAAALEAKKAGDSEKAIKYIKIVKQFDSVITALENGQEVDLSKMPPSPSQAVAEDKPKVVEQPKKEEAEAQKDAEMNEPEAEAEPEVLIEAKTIGEALQQRLEKFKSVEKAATDEGNSSKARRIGRIVKQYEQAIKLHKNGKPIPIDELPTPPGYGPIPVEGVATQASIPAPIPTPAPPSPKPAVPARVAPEKPSTSKQSTVNDKQLAILLDRQKEFRQAAVEAKKQGEVDEAKEYLRVYKGLDLLIETARGGIPIDMATVPIPPSKRNKLEDSFTIINDDDCKPGDNCDVDLNTRLEEQLSKQLILCRNTRDHHRAMGDVAGTNRFENLALSVQKDLDFVRLAHRKQLPIPKFHYEQKQFNIVKCNTELTDNEVEILIARGINYNVPNPKDVDTYVKVEFPYPQDDPFRSKTGLVKDTDNPDYNHRFSVDIQRNQRICQRVFKRHNVKCEIFSKGCRCCGRTFPSFSCFSGFLRSDVLIGTVTIKLQPLETLCEIHDSFPLMDGRKVAGGKLEVRIRVRNPIMTKQIEQFNEKWLIIDT